MTYLENRVVKPSAIRRIALGITSHFQQRMSSWLMAIATISVGLVLLNVQLFSIYNPFANYAPMSRFGDESVWGWLFFAVGVGRLITLVVNGTIPGIWWTAHARAVLTGMASLLWLQLATCVTWGADMTPASVIYPLLFVLELLNVAQAAHESRSK